MGNSAGYVRFPGLPENCMTGHMSFRGNSNWLFWTTRKLCMTGHMSFSGKFSWLFRFPGLPENCMTGHMSFSGKFSWLYQISGTTRKLYDRSHVFQREFRWLYHIMSLCVINSECNMIFIVVKIQSNISVTNLAFLKVQEIQVLVLCLFQGVTIC